MTVCGGEVIALFCGHAGEIWDLSDSLHGQVGPGEGEGGCELQREGGGVM